MLLLFDLDGTISDSAPGILAALRHAFAVNGLPRLDAATERTLLGPPFYESLPPLIGDVPLGDVIGAYRAHYTAGSMYDTVAYDGIADVLREAREAGATLAVATSKPEMYAVPIVERLGLADLFATVGGDEADGSLGTKALVIGKVLGRLPHDDDTVMIGDRLHDVAGAQAHGLRCIGAGWGYGGPGELLAAGAEPVIDRPHGLRAPLGLIAR